jgi:hypothetical protein
VKSPLIAAVCLFLLPCILAAEPISVKEYGYAIDLPEGWVFRETSSPDKLSFEHRETGGLLQISMYGHEHAMSAEQMENALRAQLKAKGDGAAFSFSGRDSYLSDIEFLSSGRPFRGYVLIVRDVAMDNSSLPPVDAALIAFAPVDMYSTAQAGLLSALDSFSPDQEGLLLPGPISQFVWPFPDPQPQSVSIPFMGRVVNARIGRSEREAGQDVVEREAAILASCSTEQISAWNRFYRMIYRDSYHRVDAILSGLGSAMASRGVPGDEVPLDLLSWIQGFSFERTGTLSDFLSPLAVALSDAGDCDSRAILYDILLDHLGYRTILFVSTRYSHALAGVVLDRPGATLVANGTRYLVAETTDRVGIGLISSDMTDPSAWIAMELRN